MAAPARKWLLRLGAWLALAVVFVAAAVGGVLLHADLPLTRRIASHAAERALSDLLGGTVVLAPLSRVTPTRLVLPRAVLLDASGAPVLTLTGVRAEVSLALIANDLLRSRGAINVIVRYVRVEEAEVRLLPDPTTGEPTLVQAISPTPAPASTAPSGGAARTVRVYLPAIEVGTVSVHGELAGQPDIEATVHGVHGELQGSPDGVSIGVSRFGAVVSTRGLTASGTGTLALGVPGALRTTFEGFVGDVELSASAFLEGSRLELTARAPQVSPVAARRLLPSWPVTDNVEVKLEARGELPALDASIAVRAGTSTAVARGPVTLGEHPTLALDVRARHLSARLFSADAPESDVTVRGQLDGRTVDGTFTLEVMAHSDATELGGVYVPAMDAQGIVRGGEVQGSANVHEDGVPLSLTFRIGKGGVVDAELETARFSAARAPRIALAGLAGTVQARGRLHVAEGKIRGSLDAETVGLSGKFGRIRKGHVTLDAEGPLSDPARIRGEARVTGAGIEVGPVTVTTADVSLRGGLGRAALRARLTQDAGPTVELDGTLLALPRPVLEATRVSIRRDPVVISGVIASLDVERRRLDVRDVSVSGAGGTVNGALRLGPGVVEGQAEGEGIDVDAIGRALGLPRGTVGGRMRINADVAVGGDVTRARVRLGIGNGTLGMVGGLSLQLSADLQGRTLSVGASGLVAGFCTFGATADGELAGSALDPSSYRDATGHAELQLGDLRLAVLSPLLRDDAPLRRITGRAYTRILLDREAAGSPLPDVRLTAYTRELALDVSPGGGEPVHLEDLQVSGSGTLDGATGATSAAFVVGDGAGDLLSGSTTVELALARLLANPEQLGEQLLDTPLTLNVSVPRRKISALPPLVPLDAIQGEVGVDAWVRGTLRHPTLDASLDLLNVSPTGSTVGRPVDLHADTRYEWTTGNLTARGTASVQGRAVATAFTRVALAGPELSYDGRVELSGLPVDVLRLAPRAAVGGEVSGLVALVHGDGTGSLKADLTLRDAVVEHTALGEGRLELETAGNEVRATLSLDAARGSVKATGTAPVDFRHPVPALGRTGPIVARLEAEDFAAVALAPLVKGVLTRLGGRVDAKLDLALHPVTEAGEPGWEGGVRGTAGLHDGSLLIEALGLEVRDLSATAEARGEGGVTHLALRDVHGRVRSATDNVRATADLELRGLRLAGGTADLSMADMPLLFRGAPQGRINGRAHAVLERRADHMSVDIDVPQLTTVLPQASTRQVIELENDPDISIVQLEHDESTGAPVFPWRLAVRLGRDVRVRRRDVDLLVTGTPMIELGDDTQVTGAVELTQGGRVPVLGKVFVIEHGTVAFDTGETTNPRLDVTAAWRAPNDSRVFVDVTGTLREAKIALRSAPPLPEPEVFALLLGGASQESSSASSSTGKQQTGAAAGAMALGSGVAALGVNELLTDNPVEVRIDTTSESRPRYTAAVRVRPNLWFEASEYQQSTGAAGTNKSVISGTVDYRFAPRWSLRTEMGTAGGALDLLWQYRY